MKNRKNILTYIVAAFSIVVTSASSSLGVPPLQHPLLLGLAPVAALSNSDEPASVTWTATGSLNTARYFHTATLLPNGNVLVAGGWDGFNPFTSAELYAPASGMWSKTRSLHIARVLHTETLLPNGLVLVAGGRDSSGQPLDSAELYDPESGTWTDTGSLNTARFIHTATLLSNGLVLVAAGFDGVNALASAELYDPALGTWTATGSLNTARDARHEYDSRNVLLACRTRRRLPA
jgi:hypothetical protein